ncbi:nucleotide sugar dehydrogenase [Halobacteriales archaeon Cl-PHB]
MSRVCVHGLGYIGLPTAAMFANYGHDVTGLDTDERVLDALENGDVHIDEPGLQAFVTEAFESGTLALSTEAEPAKYHVVCVPTPLKPEEREGDLSYVRAAGQAIRPHLRSGDTVILESTVPPRTTVDVLRPVLERSGLVAGSDFALVHCPETVLPGNVITELRENDRIIGGVNGVSTEAAVRLYESFVAGEIKTAPNATTAEFVKLLQNTYRDTNIALANEIAKLADDYDIDGRAAIALANHHPRVDLHQPGPGVGGHCLPIDPWFLGHGSDRLDLIATARDVNDGMTDYIVELLAEELDETTDVSVAVLGVAYKGNVGDTRESPGLSLARRLQARGDEVSGVTIADGGREALGDVTVRLHDPHVDDQTLSLSSLDDALAGADAAVVTADHDEYAALDPERVASGLAGDVVLDTKGVLDPATWEASDVRFRRV